MNNNLIKIIGIKIYPKLGSDINLLITNSLVELMIIMTPF